jgi:hypothetical protein
MRIVLSSYPFFIHGASAVAQNTAVREENSPWKMTAENDTKMQIRSMQKRVYRKYKISLLL